MTFEEHIAKYNLGALPLSQFPNIAMTLVESGQESESLLILAGMDDRDNVFELEEYLKGASRELNIVSHHSLNAAYVLANAYVNKVKKEEINVIEAIYRIVNECWSECDERIKSEKFLYDGIKFENIIGAWYEYYEIDDHSTWVRNASKTAEQIKAEIETQLTTDLVKRQLEFLEHKIAALKHPLKRTL